MPETTNEWNDPPGVNIDGSVSTTMNESTSNAHTPDATPNDGDTKRSCKRRGPFARARNLLSWVFWGGLVLAAVVGALGGAGDVSPVSGAVQLTLGFFVGIGIWVALLGWVLWGIDKIVVYATAGGR